MACQSYGLGWCHHLGAVCWYHLRDMNASIKLKHADWLRFTYVLSVTAPLLTPMTTRGTKNYLLRASGILRRRGWQIAGTAHQ
jgi:hypothetical protein